MATKLVIGDEIYTRVNHAFIVDRNERLATRTIIFLVPGGVKLSL